MSIPSELVYGKAEGRFLLAAPDGLDPDSFPDEIPMVGFVKFTPLVSVYKNPNPHVAAVIPQKVVCILDSDGYLRDPENNLGVWLPVGPYKVNYNLEVGRIRTHRIEILPTHTADAPLNLRGSIPPLGPVVTPSQYAELSARISALVLDSAPVSSVNAKIGDVVLDAGDVGAYSKTEIDLQYDVLEAADAAEASTRSAAVSALSTRVTELESAPSSPDLTDELAAEASARIAADNALDARVDILEASPGGAPDLTDELASETSARIAADSALDTRVTAVEARPIPDVTLADVEALTPADIGAATAAQGAKADSASQPGHTHGISDLSGVATAAQGAKADSASQPGHTHAFADVSGVAAASHTHDDRYYTETETNNLVSTEASTRASADNALDTRVTALESSGSGITQRQVAARVWMGV